jgi:transcriptional regulator with XRE-family HTH domain
MVSEPNEPDQKDDDVRQSELRELRKRIKDRMEAVGTNARTLSRAIGKGKDYVSDLLAGRNENPPPEVVRAIAIELAVEEGWLYGREQAVHGGPLAQDEIQFRFIADNAYRPPMAVDRRTSSRKTHRTRSDIYPAAEHFYTQVSSDCMDACTDRGNPTPIYPGMIAYCVDVASGHIPIAPPSIYVVKQTLPDGKFRIMLRRARLINQRIELAPESHNPEHETFVYDPTKETNISVVGLVFFWGYGPGI